MKDRVKALLFTRCEGGRLQPMMTSVFEDELDNFTDVVKKQVYNKAFLKTLNTRVVKIGKVFVHSLFFENGFVYDCDINGFKRRSGFGFDGDEEYKKFILETYQKKTA